GSDGDRFASNAQLLAGELGVVDGRRPGSGAPGFLGLADISKCSIAAAQPIVGAGLFGAAVGTLAQAAEVVEGRLRIIEKAQSDPAGEEFAFAEILAGFEAMLARHVIGELPIVAAVGSKRAAGD